jgi:hypothetical protein
MDSDDKLLTLARWLAKKYLSESNFEYNIANAAMISDTAKVIIQRDNPATTKEAIACWRCDIAKDDLDHIKKYPEYADDEIIEYYKDCEFPIDNCDADHEYVEDGIGYFYHEELSEEEVFMQEHEGIAIKLFEISGFPEDDEGYLDIPPKHTSDAIRNINRVLNNEELIESHIEEAFEIDSTKTSIDYNNELGVDEIKTEGVIYIVSGISKDQIESGLFKMRDVLMHAKLNNDGVVAS